MPDMKGWPDDCKECPCSDSDGKCAYHSTSDGSSPCDVMSKKAWDYLVKESED